MDLLSRLRELIGRGSGGPVPDRPPWWDQDEPSWPHRPDAPVENRVVDNRVLLLGLDDLYRKAMKRHERTELLGCARRVAAALGVTPASGPIEGYYAEHPDLTSYFQLVRALQAVPSDRGSEVENLPEFRRLLAVTSSPIYGPSAQEGLLPQGMDPLSVALKAEPQWTVPVLTARAARVARETDDCSLVGLAARAEDPVALTALRESVVLYAMSMTLGMVESQPEYEWAVDPALGGAAQRFVDAFNGLFGRELPPPTPKYARIFWHAFDGSSVVGRCVRLGQTESSPRRFYHWAVVAGPQEQLAVHEFWDDRVWTTEEYRGRTSQPDGP